MVLEALFSAIAEAVFGYLLQQSGLAERTRAVLGRDPQRLAFQTALARAYTAFARQYPEWKASLFDETFLKSEAVLPLLGDLLTRRGRPDPAELARRFAIHLGHPDPDRWDRLDQATRAAADFLTWLEAELADQPALQPLYDSRALERIAENTEAIRRALEEGWQKARAEAQRYVQIAGSVSHSAFVTGDYNIVTQVFLSGDYASLSGLYLPPEPVFRRVRLEEFSGREWLEADLDRFLSERDCGVWLLAGEAGVGKTTFLAHLVRERRYLHFFAEQAPGEANLPRALQSLGAQLVTRYQIEPYRKRDTLTQLSAFPDFLDRLLRLGCRVIGVDVNPVAWFVVKKSIEPVDLRKLDAAFKQLEAEVAPDILKFYRTPCPSPLPPHPPFPSPDVGRDEEGGPEDGAGAEARGVKARSTPISKS